ncbi:outer membrane protein [Roseobacter litoralis]|uniref:outer membrane protein n=1 Tax=Roseobacter litoralis TaxID=42443 RepID=UPI0024943719|nr:outer membrane beta-barrel protein [Roseobacter litoralis]
MFSRMTAIAAFALATTGAAYAAGPEPIVVEAPVAVAPPVAPFWAGAYAGVQLGYAYSDFDFDDAIDGDNDGDDLIGGIHFGYLWDVGSGWYVGPEFQYDFTDVEIRDADTGDTISFDEIARLKLVVGYELGNGLAYGSGGIAYSALDDAGDVFDGFDGSDTNYVVGFGYDYRVGDNWTIGGEYQYHDFDDLNVNTLHLKAAYRF